MLGSTSNIKSYKMRFIRKLQLNYMDSSIVHYKLGWHLSTPHPHLCDAINQRMHKRTDFFKNTIYIVQKMQRSLKVNSKYCISSSPKLQYVNCFFFFRGGLSNQNSTFTFSSGKANEPDYLVFHKFCKHFRTY